MFGTNFNASDVMYYYVVYVGITTIQTVLFEQFYTMNTAYLYNFYESSFHFKFSDLQ